LRGNLCVEAQFKSLIAAVAANSYDDFVVNGYVSFQADIRPQMLKAISVQIAPRIKRGYSAEISWQTEPK